MTLRLVALMSVVLLLSLAAVGLLVNHYQEQFMEEVQATASDAGQAALRTLEWTRAGPRLGKAVMKRYTAGPDGPENYRRAFRPNTKVVYTETPANPTCRLTDLAGVGRVVDKFYGKADDAPGTDPRERKRPWVMCDGTFATPYHAPPTI